jgi:hypothetical protein
MLHMKVQDGRSSVRRGRERKEEVGLQISTEVLELSSWTLRARGRRRGVCSKIRTSALALTSQKLLDGRSRKSEGRRRSELTGSSSLLSHLVLLTERDEGLELLDSIQPEQSS